MRKNKATNRKTSQTNALVLTVAEAAAKDVRILFIGLTHYVDQGMPSDIHVSYLIHNLPFKRSEEIDRL